MHTVKLKINDDIYNHIMFFLKSLDNNKTGGEQRIREARSGDTQGGVSGAHGRTDAMGRILRVDRTALPEKFYSCRIQV